MNDVDDGGLLGGAEDVGWTLISRYFLVIGVKGLMNFSSLVGINAL